MDPVELELAADLQKSALEHVAESSCGKHTGHFNIFVACMVRCMCGAQSDSAGIGRHCGDVFAVSDEQRQEACAGEGLVRHDRLLLKD